MWIYKWLYSNPSLLFMVIWMYGFGEVRRRIDPIVLNLLILLFFIMLGLIVVELILKSLIIYSPFWKFSAFLLFISFFLLSIFYFSHTTEILIIKPVLWQKFGNTTRQLSVQEKEICQTDICQVDWRKRSKRNSKKVEYK